MDLTQAILLTIATAATPLLIAAIGELVVERSGVLNLGVEGMMLMGAVSGFAIAQMTGSAWLGLIAAVLVGALFSAIFGFLTLTLVTNQVATGLALTILGVGASALLGESFVGLPGVRLEAIHIPYLTDLPLVGRFLFGQDPIFIFPSCWLLAWPGFCFGHGPGLHCVPSVTAMVRPTRSACMWCARAIWRFFSAVLAPVSPGRNCRSSMCRNGWKI